MNKRVTGLEKNKITGIKININHGKEKQRTGTRQQSPQYE